MKKLTKLFIIGCLLMVVVNVGFTTMHKLADSIPTAYAADGDGDCFDDETEAPIEGCTPATEEDEEEALITSPDEIADTLSQGARSLLLRFSDLLSVVLKMLNYLLWPILMMIGALMDNSIIFGGGMEDRLLQIWSQIRNIVNLLFVVILVGMALYNVLGIGEEGNYTIKKILPKFIIALIVVNFTFIGSKVILDAANVATNAVFALPNSVEEEFNLTRIDQLEEAVCGHLEDAGAYGSSINLQGEGEYSMCADDNTFTTNARQFFQRLSSNNIALVMAVNLGQIHEGIKVSELVKQEPSITNLTINILFSIIIYIVYAISFIALFIVLLVRVVVLWLIIALSPFAAVAIVLPDLASSTGNFNLKEEFIKHLTAPIIIGFGMTVGYLMLDAYHATTGNALGIQLGEQFANGFSGMSTLQQLMIGIGTVAIVWVVTFQAANNTMARGITATMESTLKRVGTNIAQLPLTVPIIPVPNGTGVGGGDKASLFNLSNAIQNASRGNEEGRSGGLGPQTGRTGAAALTVAGLGPLARRGEYGINESEAAQAIDLISNQANETSINLTGNDMINVLKAAARRNVITPGTRDAAVEFITSNNLEGTSYNTWGNRGDFRRILDDDGRVRSRRAAASAEQPAATTDPAAAATTDPAATGTGPAATGPTAAGTGPAATGPTRPAGPDPTPLD